MLPDTVFPSAIKQADGTSLPWDLTGDEWREACRALKGSVLRQEVYGLDGSEAQARPYSVSESNYTIECLQPQITNKYGVFFTHPREAISFHYERKLYPVSGSSIGAAGSPNAVMLADPRVSHAVTLEVDAFGNVLKAVEIGYGRRFDDPDPVLTAEDRQKQKQILLTYSESQYTNAVQLDDSYGKPLPCEAKSYELIHLTPDANQPQITNLFRFEELQRKLKAASDGNHDLPSEDVKAEGAKSADAYRRLLGHSRVLYRKDDLTGALASGVLESMALPYESYTLALTPGLLAKVYQRQLPGQPTENLLPDPASVLGPEGGYVDLDGNGNWWVPSGQVFYSPGSSDTPEQELASAQEHFFLPGRFQDPFQQVTTVIYDSYDLLMVDVQDPLGNRVTAGERDSSGVNYDPEPRLSCSSTDGDDGPESQSSSSCF